MPPNTQHLAQYSAQSQLINIHKINKYNVINANKRDKYKMLQEHLNLVWEVRKNFLLKHHLRLRPEGQGGGRQMKRRRRVRRKNK